MKYLKLPLLMLFGAMEFIICCRAANTPLPSEGANAGADVVLVDLGDRKLEILRAGRGSPTVVFESGASIKLNSLTRWRALLPRIADVTSVVCYSRAGRGGSEPATGPRTPEAITKDLHDLLEKAGYKPPYILVGASLGGIYARIFAMRYSRDMAGLVLIDPEHERTFFELNISKRSDEDRAKRKQSFIDSYEKTKDAWSSEQLGMVELNWSGDASAYGTMPNIPLVMITSLQGYSDAKNPKRQQYLEMARSVHSEVFKSSTLGMHIVTDKAGHGGDPDLIINAILWTVDMARKHGKR